MSVKVSIQANGVFTSPAGVQRADLVFWNNEDRQAHYPIPGCDGLRVAPEASSAPYRPAPQPDLPKTTIVYHCALHPEEEGTLIIDDPGTATGTNGPGVVRITIRPGGVFEEVNVGQPASVIWDNRDTREHFPVPNCFGFRVNPGQSTTAMQPAPNPNVPMPLIYGCAIPGHEAERGSLNVWPALAAVGSDITVVHGGAAVPVVTGGKSPYTIIVNNPVTGLTFAETAPAGTNAGVSVTASATAAVGAASVPITVTDSSNQSLTATFTITVT
ncbi:MAG: hypothetical protein JWO56_541 [Acidobacteria bacterium]|nr:hypothetical protein [Acidobacteriota bacterium]